MAGILTIPFEDILAAISEVKHGLMGDPTKLELLTRDASSGELTLLKSISKGVVREDVPVGMGMTVEEIRFPETQLTDEQNKKVHAVKYDGVTYSLAKKVPPNGTSRYWSYQLKPVEKP